MLSWILDLTAVWYYTGLYFTECEGCKVQNIIIRLLQLFSVMTADLLNKQNTTYFRIWLEYFIIFKRTKKIGDILNNP